jgi:aspartyl-tRNA(Asn)/glutamyl-tRNA(Gln) amidotransferase subunit C
MSLTLPEVESMAHLARLELSATQARRYQEQLSAILDYAAMLNELDLTAVAPTTHAVAQVNIWRADEIAPSLTLAEALANAPQKAADQFLIQAVLED